MTESNSLARRKFLQAATAAAGGAVACSQSGARYRVLSEHEAETVKAVCNQIIPPDDFPGAGDAGGADFVDRQLAGHYEWCQDAYRNGLIELDNDCREKFQQEFVELTFEQQHEILEAREDTRFFRMMLAHTMQGFYGDPRHGGNHDAVSWEMLGVNSPPVRGREHYDLTEG